MNHIMIEVRCNPLQTSKEVFKSAGVPDVPKSTWCCILRIGKCVKSEVCPSLRDIHKIKRIEWAKNNMKLNFRTFCSPMSVARPSMEGWWCDVLGCELVMSWLNYSESQMESKWIPNCFLTSQRRALCCGTKRRVWHSKKIWFSCMIMHLLVLQGLPTNIWPVFVRHEKIIRWPALQI